MKATTENIDRFREDGRPLARRVVASVFYMDRSHLERTELATDWIRQFLDLVGFERLKIGYDDNGFAVMLNEASLSRLVSACFDKETLNGRLELADEDNPAPLFGLEYAGNSLTMPDREHELSALKIWVSPSFFSECYEPWFSFFEETSKAIDVIFSYSSYALSGSDRRLLQAIAARYPGLDIASPVDISADLAEKAAGAYWLSLTGPKLTATLGGVAAIRAALPEDIDVDAFGEKSCLIRLGERPETGDVNRLAILPRYRTLAAFFEERGVLHIPQRMIYHLDERGALDREAMEAWHRRFLEPIGEETP